MNILHDYFSQLGKKGGRTLAKDKGADYFRKLAQKSHESRRKNKAKQAVDISKETSKTPENIEKSSS